MNRFDERAHPRSRSGRFTTKPRSSIDTTRVRDLADSLAQGPVDPDSGVPYSQQMPVFVYGTLRPGHGNYHYLLEGNTVEESPARLPGARMWSNGSYPYVAETDDANDSETVTGTVIHVDPDTWDQVSTSLDRLEGFTPGRSHNHYDRTLREVTLPDGSTQQAWVYLAQRHQDLDARYPRVTTGDWTDPQVDWSHVHHDDDEGF